MALAAGRQVALEDGGGAAYAGAMSVRSVAGRPPLAAAVAGPRPVRRDVTVDGLRAAVFESGAGEPCVLLHGYPQSHEAWHRVAPRLAESHRVVAVDWFGWGESERSTAAALDYDAEVARLGRLLDVLGLDRVNLFAHDYGAFLGLGFALRQGERLSRLALLNSRAHATFPWRPRLQFAALGGLARTPGLRRLFALLPLYAMHRRSLGRYVRNGSFSPADLERYLGWLRLREGRLWLGAFYRAYRVAVRPELAEGCARLRLPAAVIWGDADPYCPFSIAADLATRLPRARLVRLRGADHYVMEERPDEVVAALRALLAEPVPG